MLHWRDCLVDPSNWEVLTMNEPMLKKAMDTLEFLSQDAAARMAYNARMKALSDEKSRIEGALEEGIAKGIEKGIAKGIEKGIEKCKTETAIKLLALGVDIRTIAEATGLSVEQIKALSSVQ
jgi:predicted transposase/invertase (TIGR01784 family)